MKQNLVVKQLAQKLRDGTVGPDELKLAANILDGLNLFEGQLTFCTDHGPHIADMDEVATKLKLREEIVTKALLANDFVVTDYVHFGRNYREVRVKFGTFSFK